MPPQKKPTRTKPPGDKKAGEKFQKVRLFKAAANAVEIFNVPDNPYIKRDGVDYTHPGFEILEKVYTEAVQSGLTFHEWAEQQRKQGREPIHEVISALGGADQAAQYPTARELIENLRDLDRMGRPKKGRRQIDKGALGESGPKTDVDELYRHGWYRDQARDVGDDMAMAAGLRRRSEMG